MADEAVEEKTSIVASWGRGVQWLTFSGRFLSRNVL